MQLVNIPMVSFVGPSRKRVPPGYFVRHYTPATGYTLAPLVQEQRRPQRVGVG